MSTDHPDVRVRAGDGTPLPELTDALLGELFEQPPDPDCPFLELSRDDVHYIRARLLPDGVYVLDHRAGSPTEEFQLYTPDHVLVRDVLWSWLSGDPWWHEAVAWFPIDPEIAHIRAVRAEMSGLLDGLTVLDGLESSMGDIESSMDAALARADELLAGDLDDPDL